ncbi:hypothetical protein R1flu_021810 [Riccia fluitans]|uniref:Uncharacterized protein n=1 Tax=Riccia fluitans TaxID=41844 RepID=A0ABD1ZR23_9MARC
MEPEGGSKRYRNGQAVKGVMDVEGGVTESEAGNMEVEEGVTEAKGGVPELEAGNMEGEKGVTEVEGGVPEPEAGNMEGEEGVTKAEGGVPEAEAGNMEVERGVTEPHLEEAADYEEGLTEAREVAREMECVAGHNIIHQLRSIMSSFLCPAIRVPSEGSETEYWYRNACINLRCGQCGAGVNLT